uniref:kynurenine--oxoglutarate transaminase n=1 Tax=Echinostoma caproni TaxID=27848 RepID=A0A183BB95_9TREM
LVNVLSQLYTPFTRCDPNRYASAGSLTKDTFAPTRHLDALSEVIVSVGAYGALSAAISSLIDHGDEVIIMDPSFDCYAPMTEFAGGVPVFIPLRPTSVSGPLYLFCTFFFLRVLLLICMSAVAFMIKLFPNLFSFTLFSRTIYPIVCF